MYLVFPSRFITIAIFALALPLHGQLIKDPIHVLEHVPFLNAAIVKEWRIRELKGHVFTKRPGEMILPTAGFVSFQFDSLGQTTSTLCFYPNHSFKDSILHQFEYKEGQIIEHRTERLNDYSIETFEYQHERLINREERIGLKITGHEITTHSLNYNFEENGLQSTTSVNYAGGSLYKEIICQKDSIGRIKTQREIESLNNSEILWIFKYGNKNELKVCEKREGGQTQIIKIDYQNDMEISAVWYYNNGILMKETQILYLESGKRLNAIITLDHQSQFMEIIRF